MRITNQNQMSTYLKHMNTNLNQLTGSNNKMSSQRAFTKSWENVADATRAMRLRRLIREDERNLTNVRDVEGRMSAAEDNLRAVNDIYSTVIDRSLQAVNGTYDEDDRLKIATELENLQSQMLSLMNGQYAETNLFGAAGADKPGVPFVMEEVTLPVMEYAPVWELKPDGTPDYDNDPITGSNIPRYVQETDAGGNLVYEDDGVTPVWKKAWQSKTEPVYDPGDPNKIIDYKPVTKTTKELTYNTHPVNELKKDPATGKIMRKALDPAYDPTINPTASPYLMVNAAKGEYQWEEIPYNSVNYLDIGIGFRTESKGAGAPDGVNPETALQYTFSGAELFGVGVDEDGLSNNAYLLLGDIVNSLKNNDTNMLSRQIDKIAEVRDTLMIGITDIGTSVTFAKSMGEIMENSKLTLQTNQNAVESIDLPEETISNKNFEMAWMVTLQLGSKVLPTSLFDFMK